jgi:hypothetical protein
MSGGLMDWADLEDRGARNQVIDLESHVQSYKRLIHVKPSFSALQVLHRMREF